MTGRRLVLVLVLMLLAWVAGTYRETRYDANAGWCVHFQHVMVCNQQAATDYVFAE